MAIQDGSRVSFEYTLTVDGKIVDSSKGREPLEYIHGKGQIISGLAKQLTGMHAGEAKTIVVPPEEAYGTIQKDAYREFPKAIVSSEAELRVGMRLTMQGPGGEELPLEVVEIKEDSIVVNLNHPLAGKTLTFDVKVVSIE